MLNLIGNKGKELLNKYSGVNMLNSPMQKNIRYRVRIKDVEINIQAAPVSGKIVFTQIGYRIQGGTSCNIEAEFTIYDMLSRNKGNAYGTKIEDWIVRYSEPVKNNGANTSQAASSGKNEDQSETSEPISHGTE